MPYNPGVTDNRAQFIMRGKESLGAGLGAGIDVFMRKREEAKEIASKAKAAETAMKQFGPAMGIGQAELDAILLKSPDENDRQYGRRVLDTFSNAIVGMKVKESQQQMAAVQQEMAARKQIMDRAAADEARKRGVLDEFAKIAQLNSGAGKGVLRADVQDARMAKAADPTTAQAAAIYAATGELPSADNMTQLIAMQQRASGADNTPLNRIAFNEALREAEVATGRPMTPGEKSQLAIQIMNAGSPLPDVGGIPPGHRLIRDSEGGLRIEAIPGAPQTPDARKLDVEQQEKEDGRKGLSEVINASVGSYLALDQEGGIVNQDKSVMSNLKARVSASDIGQMVSGVTNPKVQSLRNTINNITPLLIQTIKKATGMTGTELNSNQELLFWVQMAGDPRRDILSNLVALDVIDRRFGDGTAIPEMLADNPALLRSVRARSAREGAVKRIVIPVKDKDLKSRADSIVSGGS